MKNKIYLQLRLVYLMGVLFCLCNYLHAQGQTVKGVVSDQHGEPLIGVNVTVKGDNTTGTITDMDGNFSVAVNSTNAVLLFSYIGYITQEVPVSRQSDVQVIMREDAQALDEVVVVGYGVVKKRDLVGSVASIKAQDITALPTTNVLESMQGKIPGLDMTRESGQPGSSFNFTIRGNRSLMASNAPLILVDGIAYGTDMDINPNDVESIEVLKDASSTAIYGSRGANGVIIVTTKKGSTGKAKVDFNFYVGSSMVTNFPDFMNTGQYVAMKREAYRATGVWNSPEDDSKLWIPDELARINSGVDTDWFDVIYGKGLTQNYQVSVSGGSDNTKVSFSLNYLDEKGVLKGEGLSRYNARMNVTQKIVTNLEAGLSMLFTHNIQNARNGGVFGSAQHFLPIGIPYEDDGSIRRYPFPSGTDVNPLVDEDKNNYRNETLSNRTFGTAFLNWGIIKGLTFQSNLGFDFQNSRNGIFEGINSTRVQYNDGVSHVEKTERRLTGVTWENVLTYNQEVDIHSFSIMGGHSMQKNTTEETYAEGKDLAFEESLFHNLDGAQKNFLISSDYHEQALLSFFGRLNYKLKDNYLLTATLRADGSSVLADGNKWGYFPSVAVAWRIKNEPFLVNKEQLSDMKIRLSYGLSGNSAVSPYQTLGSLSKTIYAFEENAAYGYRPYNLANKDLKWEKTTVLNLGVDMGFFNNRLYATVDAYKTWTSDLLMTMIIPGHTGFTSVIGNVGKTETRGIDLSLNTVNMDKRHFRWTSDLTFTANKEKITALNTEQDDVSNSWFIGQPTQVLYDYNKIGIWQLNEAELAARYGQEPGDIKVEDVNNDGTISANDDRKILGQKTPKWTAGLNNRFEYKGWELSFFLYARIGNLISSEAALNFYPSAFVNSANVDYWTPENATNAYPRPNASKSVSSMLYYETLGYRKGDFLKIKDITFGYTFPRQWISKANLSKLRVYATAKNFFTFSKFNDYDPERGGPSSYPMTKQVVVGVNVSF